MIRGGDNVGPMIFEFRHLERIQAEKALIFMPVQISFLCPGLLHDDIVSRFPQRKTVQATD
jgi:hypothetical protein